MRLLIKILSKFKILYMLKGYFKIKNNTLEYLSEDRIFLNEFVALIND